MDSYIVRVYRRGHRAAQDGPLAGIVENLKGETCSFHSVHELWAILGQRPGLPPDRPVDDPPGPPRPK